MGSVCSSTSTVQTKKGNNVEDPYANLKMETSQPSLKSSLNKLQTDENAENMKEMKKEDSDEKNEIIKEEMHYSEEKAHSVPTPVLSEEDRKDNIVESGFVNSNSLNESTDDDDVKAVSRVLSFSNVKGMKQRLKKKS